MTPADDYDIGFTGARFGGAPRKRRKKKKDDQAVAEVDTAAIPVVDAEPAAAAEPAVPQEPAGFHEVPDVGYTGARFGGSSRRRRDKEAHPEPIRVLPEPAAAVVEEPVYEEFDDSGRSLAVRPYFYTKGRTRSRYELAIETLVSTQAGALTRPELVEHRVVLDLCREPKSVAEVGALLGIPLGVARVVVGDLAVTGALEVHSTVAAEGPDVALMERVLAGLRRL
ncbi:DUF742 domain-containing protein [Pseudonocardia sp. WMMC193]|uniref:DUF742 domain-containing protein n=1 Tax=Pseudonocardia sp. WMMC193 TaxID=2911965 RepID=UPI001F1FE92E|nr:DUF742 domain-containing protein [Pseudonocardia sp. WMMC193]MCF7548818.1 DUF742 domain-containing protein [Pseudonocardia sp. WMMC193]